MSKEEFAILFGMLNKLGMDIALNKAINTVLLTEISKMRGSELEEIQQSIIEKRDEFLIAHDEAVKSMISDAYGQDPPPAYIEDFLK